MTKYGVAMKSGEERSGSEVMSNPGAVNISNPCGPEGSILPITGHRLNGQNFIQWSQSVMLFVCGKGKEDYLTGAAAPPQPDDLKFKVWKLENSMVMSWLINSMTNETGENFMYYKPAK